MPTATSLVYGIASVVKLPETTIPIISAIPGTYDLTIVGWGFVDMGDDQNLRF